MPVDSEEIKVPQLTDRDVDTLTRLLTVESSDVTKRFLRGETKKDLATTNKDSGVFSVENEERGAIPSKIMNMINKYTPSSIKNIINKVRNGWAKWKANMLEKSYEHMLKNGETPEMLAKRLNMAEPRNQRLYNGYAHWSNTRKTTGTG